MAITFVGVATNPADNSNIQGPTVAVTPVAGMQDGDLCLVSVRYRDSAATLAVSNTGGQSWNNAGQYNATNIRAALFWCRFNGTWTGGDPSFTVTSGGNNEDAQMLVFRPTSAARTWKLESGPNGATYTAPANPFTVTVTGRTTTAESTVTLAAWHSVDDNSWGTLSGTGWSKTSLGAQYRNNGTADNSSTFAYYIASAASTAIPNVSQNQTALGGDAGSTSLHTFAEIDVTGSATGVATTGSVGSLGVSNIGAGPEAVIATAVAGSPTTSPAGGGNAAPNATGVSSAASAGVVTASGFPIVVPPAAVSTVSAGSPGVAATAIGSPAGVSATASVGSPAAVGGGTSSPVVPGISSTALAGSLRSSITQQGIAGVQATSGIGVASGFGGTGLAGGQASAVFATAQAGSPAASPTVPVFGVSATAAAELLDATSVGEDLDGAQAAGQAGTAGVQIVVSPPSAIATGQAGNPAAIAGAVAIPSGVSAAAAVGNAAGSTSHSATGVPGGVSSAAQAGTIAPAWTGQTVPPGVSASTAAGTALGLGGDSFSTETFPAGAVAIALAGNVSVHGVFASPGGVSCTALAGHPAGAVAASVLLTIDEIRIEPALDGTVSIEPRFSAAAVKVEAIR